MSDIQSVAFTVFNTVDGSIRYCGQCAPGDLGLQFNPPNSLVVGQFYNPDEYYLDLVTSQVILKTAFAGLPASIPVNTVHTVAVPNPTYVRINNASPITVTDGTLEIEPSSTGTYIIEVFGPRLRRWQGTFNAT